MRRKNSGSHKGYKSVSAKEPLKEITMNNNYIVGDFNIDENKNYRGELPLQQ